MLFLSLKNFSEHILVNASADTKKLQMTWLDTNQKFQVMLEIFSLKFLHVSRILITAWKVSVFGVILVRIFPAFSRILGKMREKYGPE